jgi:GNAT superfamily N-acetyltransferase
MDPHIREARLDDVAGIASWTERTFEWGDYLSDVLPDWIDDPAGTVLVAEGAGGPIAVARVAMVSPAEAWAQGARVHPDHRRRGIATELSTRLWDWARRRGARVVRLAVEDDNLAADQQVTAMGFRRICDWRFATRRLGERSPVPEGNGGRRVPAAERLQPAHSAEAEPAFFSWSAGELAKAARGLFPIGWVWRTMTVDHAALAARSGALWEGRPGWAIVEREEDSVRTHWLETAETDASSMVRALVDHAAGARRSRIDIMAPAVPWLESALVSTGFTMQGLGVYALTL